MAAASICVVIAVLNGARTLRRCLESVIHQDLPCELIVMDGGSTDETVSIVRAYGERIDHWESAPDRGISDAWNKALGRSKADWICFLGADDYFSDSSSLSKIATQVDAPDVNFVSSRVALVNPAGECVRVVGEPWNWESMKKRQVIAHPGALHHQSLFQSHGTFNTRYRIAADYEFLLRAGHEVIPRFVSAVTVYMGNQGLSQTRAKEVLEETRLIQAVHPEIGILRANLNYLVARSKQMARKFALWSR